MTHSTNQRNTMKYFVKDIRSTTIYSTGWNYENICKSLLITLRAEFEKIRMAVADFKSNELRKTLKRASEALEPDTSKKQKSTEAPTPYVPDVPQPPVNSGDIMHMIKTFNKMVSDEDSVDEAPILWSSLCCWDVDLILRKVVKVRSFGVINLIGRLQNVRGCYTTILMCMSLEHFSEMVYVHVCEIVPYPLSVKLMKRMLKHKLEIAKDVVGNDMTTAEQLIRFIKNQLAA
ncbi:hypothetical protein Tco_0678527 [Tanacetum coccineum]|uniref:Uncharacterized protein n=1 Tax=Tanacetum coccineum TaxID=301880 RepID=A0ABQ4XG88_9ASTR